MGFAKKEGVRVEVVVFQGRKYRRYPDSPKKVHRLYFGRSGHLLHRDVWEHHHGPIPDGHHVHHIDEDPGNNNVDNLECLSIVGHRAAHADAIAEHLRSDGVKQHMANIRPAAAEWHRSDEGRAWHKNNAIASLAAARRAKEEHPPQVAFVCRWCGTEGVGGNNTRLFCGSGCQTAESRYRLGKRSTVHPHYAASLQPDSGGG